LLASDDEAAAAAADDDAADAVGNDDDEAIWWVATRDARDDGPLLRSLPTMYNLGILKDRRSDTG